METHTAGELQNSQRQASPVRNAQPERFLVLLEPYDAMFRYLQVAHKRYRTLVLTTDAADCLSRERRYNLSMGLPGETQIDSLIQCDTANATEMSSLLRPLKSSIAGVLAGEDAFVPVSAALGRSFHFDYAENDDAIAHHLKSAMKLKFLAHGVPTARFFIARTFNEAVQAWEQLGRNCMVKMVDFAASMNIFRVTSRQELESAWDTIINNRKNIRSRFTLAQEVILEEFIGGRELSVEGYVQNDRIVCLNVCEKVTESNFVVVGHFLPALVSEEEAKMLRRIAEQCVRAVGMRNSVFHVEIHLYENRPYVIECASRPPGQHMVDLMQRSYGFDLMEISVALATGDRVHELPREPKRHFAMLALYSTRAGTLERVDGLEELKRRGGVVRINLEAKPGDRIAALTTFHNKYGFVVLEDDTAAGAREKARWMRKHVQLVIARE